jgi:hypothetical protein
MHRTDLFAALLAGSSLVAAPVAAQSSSPYPLFAEQTPLELRITAPFEDLSNDDEERPEYPAVVELTGADGEQLPLDIEIRIRGNSRVANCSFPPLSLDFPRDGVAGTVFAGQDRIKLVVVCEPRNSRHRDYLAQEFLIYRMLNALTDRSFRVRWANVEYVYSDNDRRAPFVEPAFLIEEDWEVAERLGMQVVEAESLSVASLDAGHTALLTAFQYLIGNTDWAVINGPPGELCCHNGKVVANNGEAPYIVLPYDFDNAGLINAEYAFPSDRLPIRSVTQRLYRGFCGMSGEVGGAIAMLEDHRERLLGILDDERLSERGRERAVDFVGDSFEILNDPRDRERRIYADCRKVD